MKTKTLRIRGGQSAYWVVLEAARISKQHKCLVRFTFNGMRFVASPKKGAYSLLWDFTHSVNRRIAHENLTEEARAYAEELAETAQNVQAIIDEHLGRLDSAIAGGRDAVVGWLQTFLKPADYIKAQYDRVEILRKLQAAGYVIGDCLDLPPESYKQRDIAGRWLIGQVMWCYATNCPVPADHVASKFTAYFTLENPQ